MRLDSIKLFKIIISVVISVTVIMAGFIWWVSYEPSRGGNFKLNHQGRTWEFFEHSKKLNLIYVGYAKCPDVCPMSFSFSSQAFRQLNDQELLNVQMIFISVDHKYDTAEAVALYATQFFPSFIGLTGTEEQINYAVNLIGASYMFEENPKSYLGYSIAHSDRIFFLNKKGHVVDSIPNPRSSNLILEKIRSHL